MQFTDNVQKGKAIALLLAQCHLELSLQSSSGDSIEACANASTKILEQLRKVKDPQNSAFQKQKSILEAHR